MRRITLVAIAVVALASSFFGGVWFLSGPVYDKPDYPKLVRGQTLSFQKGANRKALLSGWSGAEPWGVWSEGDGANLAFIVSGIGGKTATLSVECVAYINAKLPEQTVEIWSGNIKLSEVTLKTSNNSFSIPLSSLRLRDDTPLVLGLKLPSAASPKDTQPGNSDTRKLAIGLQSVRFNN